MYSVDAAAYNAAAKQHMQRAMHCEANISVLACNGPCQFLHAQDTLAERLRRRPAKPMGSPRVGSNPTGVGSHAAPAHGWLINHGLL